MTGNVIDISEFAAATEGMEERARKLFVAKVTHLVGKIVGSLGGEKFNEHEITTALEIASDAIVETMFPTEH